MKRNRPNGCILLISLFLVAITWTACLRKNSGSDNEMAPLYASPKIIVYNEREGYRFNPVTGDSIQPLVNRLGDTIITGRSFPVKFNSTKIMPPKPSLLGEPKIISNRKSVYKIPNDINSTLVSETLHSPLSNEVIDKYHLVNTTGDTLKTNVPIRVSGRLIQQPLLYFSQALVPRMRDKTMHDIQYIDVEQGLGSSNVGTVLMDGKGNLWIGSDGGGLNRYDGTFLTNYKFMGGEYIRFIYEDKNNYLWFGGPDGLARYDGNNFIFYTENEGLPTNWVTSIVQDKNGTYWIGTFGAGLIKYTISDTIENFTYYTIKEGLPSNYINSLLEDSNGFLWIGSRDAGACRLRLKSDKKNPDLEFFYINQQSGLSNSNVWSMAEDKEGRIWLATLGGVNVFEVAKNEKQGTLIHIGQKDGLPGDYVYSVFADKDNTIWLGTDKGIARLDWNEQKSLQGSLLVHFTEEEGLTNNVVFDFDNDISGSLWIATYGGGINRINKGSFSYITKTEGLLDNTITAIEEASDDSFWIGTFGGLVHFNFENATLVSDIHQYTLDQGLPSPIIREIVEDHKQNIWLATNAGVVLIEAPKPNSHLQMTLYTKQEGLSTNVIRTLLEDRKGNIWIGTNGGGVNCLSRNGNEFKMSHFSENEGLPGGYIRTIHEDKSGNLWFGTNAGLTKYTPESDSSGILMIYTEREGLPINFVNSILEDSVNLWLATDKGLACFENFQSDEKKFVYYSEQEGLSDNWVWGILGVPQGRSSKEMWIAAWTGLNVIQDNKPVEQVFKLTQLDGLKGIYTQIWDKACLLDSKDRIWWGRAKGLEILDLNKFVLSSTIPQPVLRQLDINGAQLDYSKRMENSNKKIEYPSKALFENYPLSPVLSYRNNHLTFHYSAIDWAAPHKIRYSYIMDRLDKEWSAPVAETKAEYRNLPAGTYTFKLRAVGESQIWSEPFEYSFTIRPPWWYSWWAFTMYGFFGGFILYKSHRFQVNRKLEIAEKKRLVELDRIKNRLYTNITHEFRTPLTLIHGPVSQAMSKNETLDKKDLQSIYKQSERLQQLITQMLELQKLEAGMLKPNYSYGEIIQTLRYLFGSFETWAEEKKISMIFSSSLQEVYMDFDKEKLTQIISNLISNAIKHTPRNGKVAMILNISESGNFLIVNVTDTGIGISDEDLPFVFDRFYQSKKAAIGGTGIGLALVKNLTELLGGNITVESKPDIGSTFTISLPITKKAPVMITTLSSSDSLSLEVSEEPENMSTGKPIVLIVEDHPDVSNYIVSLLTPEFTTVTAVNGNDGIRLAHEYIPDLIISDIMMPGKDGFELCTMLKADIKTSHIPVILLTGLGDHEAMMSGIEQGADAYVLKPFDPRELVLRIRKLLELRSSLSQYYRQHATTANLENVAASSAKENAFLKRARTFIEENLNDSRFNMDMICRHLAMSHPQLHRKMTALTGDSAGKFVRAIRLAKAIDLLKNSDMTISEIAYETGFSDPGYFTKVFSREYHMSPTEYRANKS